MSVDVILGLQRGDEGKGRIVDLFAEKYNVIARFNGGPNAGHTIVPNGNRAIALHQLPSGIAYRGKVNVIGNGAFLDPVKLINEIREVEEAGYKVSPENLRISTSAHLILPHHVLLDEAREASSSGQGSTKSGIAFVARDKYLREGVRAEAALEGLDDLQSKALSALQHEVKALSKVKPTEKEASVLIENWVIAVSHLKKFLCNTVDVLHASLSQNKRVLAEGAQAFGLDVDHGMYPFVTSSHTSIGGVLSGLGVSAKEIGVVTGVTKVIKSHVGGGPFVTEITDGALAESIRGPRDAVDSEYGATTKRARRIGYFDLVELRNAVRVNGIDQLVLTKMDCVSKYGSTMKVAVGYEYKSSLLKTAPDSADVLEKCTPKYVEIPTWGDVSSISDYAGLPKNAKDFVELVEKELGIKVYMLGVGPGREQVIVR